jgi:Transposase DDE domain
VHKAAIEAHLSRRSGELFAVEKEVLLYDVTSTYCEGEAAANPLPQRGYSRDHRGDLQALIALIVTFDGFLLGHEVFAGNTHDSQTLQMIVTTMLSRHGALGRVWITDRGMASKENMHCDDRAAARYMPSHRDRRRCVPCWSHACSSSTSSGTSTSASAASSVASA